MKATRFGDDWEMRWLGDHLKFLRHGTNPRSDLTADGSVRYLHYGDIHTSADPYLDPDARPMPTLTIEQASLLDPLDDGDLVFVDASEDLSGIGKSVELKGLRGRPVVAGLHTIAVRFNKSVLADGFKAYLQFHPAFCRHLRRLAAGTKVYATNRTHIASARLPLPPLPEQRAIAAVLSDVDELIGSLEALIAKKRAIKQAAMQELLTGRTRLSAFGGEWEVKRLEEVAVVTMGQSPPSASYNVVGDGLPLIQGNADIVRRTTIDRIWTTLPSKRCSVGDIVLTVRAPVGSVARASRRSCLGRGVCGLKPLGHGQFLYYGLILRESHWEDVEQGSTFSAANSAQVAGFPIAVPMDLPEQQAIATILSDMDAEIAALQRRLDKTRAIKQGMMQQLLTGAIRLPIPDADGEGDPIHDA